MKVARGDLCKDMVMIRLDPPHEGVYRPFKEALAEHLSREVSLVMSISLDSLYVHRHFFSNKM